MSANFRYTPDIVSTIEPWRDELGRRFEDVVSRLADRDRQVEDYLSSLGRWQEYTPGNINITVDNGTQIARYATSGALVFWTYRLEFGSGTAFGGTIQVGLPLFLSPSAATINNSIGHGFAIDSSVGTIRNLQVRQASTGRTGLPFMDNGVGVTNSTIPFTWATGDELILSGMYEALVVD